MFNRIIKKFRNKRKNMHPEYVPGRSALLVKPSMKFYDHIMITDPEMKKSCPQYEDILGDENIYVFDSDVDDCHTFLENNYSRIAEIELAEWFDPMDYPIIESITDFEMWFKIEFHSFAYNTN